MSRKSAAKKSQTKTPLLLVGLPSPETDRKTSLLEANGFTVTRADTICHAELFAAELYFDAAVYDSSVTPQEQISLARIMRVRWPWMRLVSIGHLPPSTDHDLFDARSTTEQTLPTTLHRILIT